MSKHERKLDDKSPAQHAIKSDHDRLDNNDLNIVSGGVSFEYGSVVFQYTQQKADGVSTSATQKK